MKISSQQITARGIAQQSGLETLSSIINYTGEHINFGNPLAYGSKLNTDTDYATETATPHIGALNSSPPSVINNWYRYHSAGSLYTDVVAPTSAGGFFIFPSIKTGGLPSYSGIYQKLSLIPEKEYQVNIQTAYTTSIASLYVNTYTPDSESYILKSESSLTFPSSAVGFSSVFTSSFIAASANDIIVIYLTTTETSSQSVLFSNITIQEKQEYLVPVYASDMWGNANKVLRRAEGQSLDLNRTSKLLK